MQAVPDTPNRPNTRNTTRLAQKRQLESQDGPEISEIATQPQPKKKSKGKKKNTDTAAAPCSPPPAPSDSVPSVNPAPASTTPITSAPVPATKPAKKVKKSKALANAPADATDGTQIESQPPKIGSQSIHQSDQEPSERPARKKKPSGIAQQVIEQAVHTQQKKDTKAKQRAKKVQDAAIDETPEDTRAFLERARATQSQQTVTGAQNTIRDVQPSKAQLTKRQAMELLMVHRTTPGVPSSTVSSLSANSIQSRDSSIAPSQSASQRHSTPSNLSTQPVRLRAGSLQPFFRATSMQPSMRDVSPAPSLEVTDLGVDVSEFETFADFLKDVPPILAPVATVPDPLPGPARAPQRVRPLPPVDYSGMTARERAATKVARKLKVKDLIDPDKTVVSATLGRLEALLVTHGPFPNDETWRILAQQANNWACRKYGKNLTLTEADDYEQLLYSRSSSVRSAILKEAQVEVPLAYGLKPVEGNQEALRFNKDLVEKLLEEGNFTCPSFDQLDDFYENPVFTKVLRLTYFQTLASNGPTHSDLWQYITVPSLAFVATGVEKVLLEYKSGERMSLQFRTKEFRTSYFAHVAALATMYKTNPPRLKEHCRKVALELHRPFGTLERSLRPIEPRVPISIIAARYGQASSRSHQAQYSSSSSVSVAHPTQARHITMSQNITQFVNAVQAAITPMLVNNAPNEHDDDPQDIEDIIYGATENDDETGPNAYNGLLRQVSGGSSDSEAEARRAGAIPGSSLEGVDREGKNSNNDAAAASATDDDSSSDDQESDGEGRSGAALPAAEPMLIDQGSSDSSSEEGSSEDE